MKIYKFGGASVKNAEGIISLIDKELKPVQNH